MRAVVSGLCLVALILLLTGCGDRPVANADPNKKKPKKPGAKPATKIDIDPNMYASVPAALEDVKRLAASGEASAGHELLKTETWIVRQGDGSVALLAERVADNGENLAVRMTACRILAKLGPPGRPAVTAATDSPKKELRVKAIESLGRIKPVEKASLDKLMSLLDDKEYDIRKAALLGIKATDKEGAAATTRLMAVLNDTKEDETIRSLAKDALKSVDPRKGLMGADKPK
jgi:hypothetical protein